MACYLLNSATGKEVVLTLYWSKSDTEEKDATYYAGATVNEITREEAESLWWSTLASSTYLSLDDFMQQMDRQYNNHGLRTKPIRGLRK